MKMINHFVKIHTFLQPFQKIWNQEILYLYPNTLDHYPDDWIKILTKQDWDTLWTIDTRKDFSSIGKHPLRNMYEISNNLSHIASITPYEQPNIPIADMARIKDKKKHELQVLLPFIEEAYQKNLFHNVVDIGGGVGHLSRLLASRYNITSSCVEINQEFIDQGEKNLLNIGHHKNLPVDFINLDVHKTSMERLNQQKCLFNNNNLIIGLHSCGPLSVKLIQAVIHYNCRGLLNFGCCYFKCNPHNEINLSSSAKNLSLAISPEALTLATRANNEVNLSSFFDKKQVKCYRYALHFLLYHEFGQTEFKGVGNYKVSDYYNDFATYAKTKLQELNIPHHLSEYDLNCFYSSNLAKLKQYFVCNMIRWIFGRPLEIYLLLDRVLYLQESGYHTTLKSYFKENISPRNLGIWAIRNNN